MKKILVFLIVFAELALLAPFVRAQTVPGEKRLFLVTAYYSPLPGQRFYMRGSLDADVRLNGRGTNGADGTEVFPGMLAAPPTYPFGTRIRLPGLGVGEVHDRGGAIISRGEYDRIDVWMGHGEEGLARALHWGAKFVEGEVFFIPHQAEPGLSFDAIPSVLSDAVIARLQQRRPAAVSETPSSAETSAPAPEAGFAEAIDPLIIQEQERLQKNRLILAAGLGKNATGEEVGALQRMLWELGYYHGPVSRSYDELTIDAVFRFQSEYGILSAAYERGAGYYGKKTHAALIAALDRRIEILKEYPQELQTWVPAKISLPALEELTPASEPQPLQLNFAARFGFQESLLALLEQNLGLGDRGEAVTALQRFLIREGYLARGLDTGNFGYQTRAAVQQFQLEKGVIQTADDPGAGLVGPKTRDALKAFL